MKNKIIRNLKHLGIQNKNLAKSLESVFNDKAGIINALLERNELRKFGLYMYQTLSAKSTILFNNEREVSSGGLGVSTNRNTAIVSSFFEALERYCMSCTNPKLLVNNRYLNLPKRLQPSSFAPYSRKQYGENKLFKDPRKNKIHWVELHEYKNAKERLYWPASLIYLPFQNDRAVAETSSTGVAANTNLDKAVLSGLLELIERDALMINFGLPIQQNQISLMSLKNSSNWSLVRKVLKAGFRIRLYKLYSDINIPIYMGYVWKKTKNGFHFGIGGSANLSSDLALEKTLKECLFSYSYSKNILDLRQKRPGRIKQLYEHYLYYQDEKKFQKLLNRKTVLIDYSRETISKRSLLRDLQQNGRKVFYFDLTTSDVKSFCKVVKVVVPGLIDLNKSHLLPRLGEKRYRSIKKKLELKGRFRLSKEPHPFP